jgi:hypothetical protein
VVSDAAHDHLAELMGVTYKSKFVDGWYQQGSCRWRGDDLAQLDTWFDRALSPPRQSRWSSRT